MGAAVTGVEGVACRGQRSWALGVVGRGRGSGFMVFVLSDTRITIRHLARCLVLYRSFTAIHGA